MAFRKYDTCFFERYAMMSLQTLLGHKFDDLVNEDRPDLQSADHKRLGIEVTRAMEGGKSGAQQMLKTLAGISPRNDEEKRILATGYSFGLSSGKFVGGIELGYWKTAKSLKDIIRSKVSKVSSGFYGEFDEFGLYVFSKDPMTEEQVEGAVRFTMDLQKDLDVKYRRLFICESDALYACNLEDDIAFEYRVSTYQISQQMKKEFYLRSLNLKED